MTQCSLLFRTWISGIRSALCPLVLSHADVHAGRAFLAFAFTEAAALTKQGACESEG